MPCAFRAVVLLGPRTGSLPTQGTRTRPLTSDMAAGIGSFERGSLRQGLGTAWMLWPPPASRGHPKPSPSAAHSLCHSLFFALLPTCRGLDPATTTGFSWTRRGNFWVVEFTTRLYCCVSIADIRPMQRVFDFLGRTSLIPETFGNLSFGLCFERLPICTIP